MTETMVGSVDSQERKRILNRLRQRSWRQRQRALSEHASHNTSAEEGWAGYGMLVMTSSKDRERETAVAASLCAARVFQKHERVLRAVVTADMNATTYRRSTPTRAKLIPALVPYARSGVFTPSPIHFPLSPDHLLISLVQYNAVRAIIGNLLLLSKSNELPPGCLATLDIPHLDPPPPSGVPTDLRPSLVQLETRHPFWIDAIPSPRLRDNMITMAGHYDMNALLLDLGQGIYEGYDDPERHGIVAWTAPWRTSGWEISEGFVVRWGFLLAGCEELVVSTNLWRARRGEDDFSVEELCRAR